MTPEERFDKIENGPGDLIVVSRTVLDSVMELREGQERNDRAITGVLQAIAELEQRNRELQDLQRTTSEKLNMLIDAVDRMTRNQGNGPVMMCHGDGSGRAAREMIVNFQKPL